MKTLCFGYNPPGRTILTTILLNSEVAEVIINTNDILKKTNNLTLGKFQYFN